jgi:hypothetical protein
LGLRRLRAQQNVTSLEFEGPRPAPNGNGGRHCCQPPLRRAKDLPVFVTWSKTRRPRPALDPGSPAQASLPIEPLSPKRSLTSTGLRFPKVRLSFDVRPVRRPKSSLKTVRLSAALLGSTPLASRFAHQIPKNPGAASRLRRKTLPAPLPGWPRIEPESSFHCLPAEIGSSVPSSTFWPLPAFR